MYAVQRVLVDFEAPCFVDYNEEMGGVLPDSDYAHFDKACTSEV